jgi:alkanesulfonate monooxygenase SsuD/methylene tetrahydromethanopterin reductase-like flavin-dependent oxidoreductase (luciferase family)
MHPLRFGIITIQDLPWPTLVEHWKHIESLGYDSVWVADHFVNSHNINDDWYDGWTLLAALATQTSRIRIGPLVTNIIYRNPALIARQAQTIDHVSQGRLELAIGATSERDPSHGMTGIETWPTAERVQRYREVVEIVDLMLRQEATTYEGRYYQVRDGRIRPPCVQRPRPPLTIAAHGQATLRIAAKYADTWNSYGAFGASPQDALALTRQRSEMLDRFSLEAGRDPRAISRSFLVGLTADTPFASLNAFYDFVGPLSDIGINEFIFYYDYPAIASDRCMNREMLELIANEAIPKFRAKGAD